MESNRRFNRYAIRVRAQLKGHNYKNIPCSSAVWVDDISAGGAKITFPPETQVTHKELAGLQGTLRIRNMEFDFKEVYISNCLGIVSIGVKFKSELSRAEMKKVIYSEQGEDDNRMGLIHFKTASNINELSLYESIGIQTSLCVIVDIAYQIYAEIFAQENKNELLFMPPRYNALNSGIPMQGTIEAMGKIVEIIKVADDILRNRMESKRYKREEMLRIDATHQQKIQVSSSFNDDAFIKRNSRNFDIFQRQMSLAETPIVLSQDECALIREQLALSKDALQSGSCECELFEAKLLPRLMVLFDKSPFRLDLSYGKVVAEKL